jgi:hypothetical protein
MASYKEIFGTNIEVLASDPANPVTGQVWYNSTDNVVKGAAATTAGAWATGNTMNTARQAIGGMGTQTSALAFGGRTGPPIVNRAETESYDGTSWTEVSDLNSAREFLGAAGSGNTNALAFGGGNPPVPSKSALTELWAGSSWTEVTDMNTARSSFSSAIGVLNTAALAAGGTTPPPFTGITESWNGSSWTEVNDLNTARLDLGGIGTSTAGLVFGGETTVDQSVVEQWNGTSWTEVGDINTARRDSRGSGTYTDSIAFGGYSNPTSTYQALTELWNGSTWSETSDLSVGVTNHGGAGQTQSAGLSFGGGGATGLTAATEEWTGAGAPVTVTFTDS